MDVLKELSLKSKGNLLSNWTTPEKMAKKSGPIPPNPSELLGSKGMNTMLEQAKNEYDVIILDTPPVLAVTDAQILSNVADGVVLVVSSGKTETEAAKKAKELLESAKAKILGVVLNNKKVQDSQYYYYYGGK